MMSLFILLKQHVSHVGVERLIDRKWFRKCKFLQGYLYLELFGKKTYFSDSIIKPHAMSIFSKLGEDSERSCVLCTCVCIACVTVSFPDLPTIIVFNHLYHITSFSKYLIG